jgi:hypothetical protein
MSVAKGLEEHILSTYDGRGVSIGAMSDEKLEIRMPPTFINVMDFIADIGQQPGVSTIDQTATGFTVIVNERADHTIPPLRQLPTTKTERRWEQWLIVCAVVGGGIIASYRWFSMLDWEL